MGINGWRVEIVYYYRGMPITRAEQIRSLMKEVALVRTLALNQRQEEIAIDAKWEDACDQEFRPEAPIVSKYTERKERLRALVEKNDVALLKYFDRYAPFVIQFGSIPWTECKYYMSSQQITRLRKLLVKHHTEWW